MPNEFYLKRIVEHLEVINLIKAEGEFWQKLNKVALLLVKTFKKGNKLLICGNGGSAADAQHLAAELVGRFSKDREPLNAEALTVNTSSLTAIGNDYNFELVFSRQIEAKGKKGDVLLAITTSGNSKNVIKAVEKAKEKQIITIGLTGANPNTLIEKCADICLKVPSRNTPRIQEAHILIGHILCEFVEEQLFGKN